MKAELTAILTQKRPELVDLIDPEHGLLNELMSMNVLTKRQVKSIEVLRDPYKQNEALIDALHKRPDSDFDQFCIALTKSHQEDVVKLLRGSSSSSQRASSELSNINALPFPIVESTGEELEKSSLEEKLKLSDTQTRIFTGINPSDSYSKSDRDKIQIVTNVTRYKRVASIQPKSTTTAFYNEHQQESYPMSRRCRGKCYIFIISEPSQCPSVDSDSVAALFESLHFAVDIYSSTTAQNVRTQVEILSCNSSLQNDQALVIFIISCGKINSGETENGYKKIDYLFDSNNEHLYTKEILEPLTDENCASLRGKPKIIFFLVVESSSHRTEMDAVPDADENPEFRKPVAPILPNHKEILKPSVQPLSLKDFIISFATLNGLHDRWYIDAMIREFVQSSHDTDLCAMLRSVNGAAGQHCDTSCESARRGKDGNSELENESKSYKEDHQCPAAVSSFEQFQPRVPFKRVASNVDMLTKTFLYFFPGIQDP